MKKTFLAEPPHMPASQLPVKLVQEHITQWLCDFYRLSYAHLSSQLAVFAVCHIHNVTGLLTEKSMRHVKKIASLIGAGFGFSYMYTLGAFSFFATTGIVFCTESLYKHVKFRQLNFSQNQLTPEEDTLPSFSTMLKIALLLFSFMISIYFDDISYLEDMALSLGLSIFLEKLFMALIGDVLPRQNPDFAFFEFLFIQICVASIQDIKTRYMLRETIINKFAPQEGWQNTDVDFSWRWWFFSPHFSLTDHNVTHTRDMICQPTSEITMLQTDVDVRGLASCVLQSEYLMLLRPV